jgi:hypothetical protein
VSDLSEYFSDKDRIVELESQVADLERRLMLEDKMKRHYKMQWRMATSQHETKTDTARRLVKAEKASGNIGSLTTRDRCRALAKTTGLGWKTIQKIWYNCGANKKAATSAAGLLP